jgi:hypothetical protein
MIINAMIDLKIILNYIQNISKLSSFNVSDLLSLKEGDYQIKDFKFEMKYSSVLYSNDQTVMRVEEESKINVNLLIFKVKFDVSFHRNGLLNINRNS